MARSASGDARVGEETPGSHEHHPSRPGNGAHRLPETQGRGRNLGAQDDLALPTQSRDIGDLAEVGDQAVGVVERPTGGDGPTRLSGSYFCALAHGSPLPASSET